MDQTVVLLTKRGIKNLELVRSKLHGDIEPKDNSLPEKIITLCLGELRGIWNIGKEYLGVKGKWQLIEAPQTGICGWYCRAVVANAANLEDHTTWNTVFVGELRPNSNPDLDPGPGPDLDPNPCPNPNPSHNPNLPKGQLREEFQTYLSHGKWLDHDTFAHDLLQNDARFATGVMWLRIIANGSLGPTFEGCSIQVRGAHLKMGSVWIEGTIMKADDMLTMLKECQQPYAA
jgi:hypothetical protein